MQKALEDKNKFVKRDRLDFRAPHVFRVKSEQSLAHLRESQTFATCLPCSQEKQHREQVDQRPKTSSSKRRTLPPSKTDLERLSRPKTAAVVEQSNNINWSNFLQKKSRYAIKSAYAFCDADGDDQIEVKRPPFVNYGGRYDDKQTGEKRTFNSLAVHQIKHRQMEEKRLHELIRERRLRLQAENYFREMEERRVQAQQLQDRMSRISTEYRDNFQPPNQQTTRR